MKKAPHYLALFLLLAVVATGSQATNAQSKNNDFKNNIYATTNPTANSNTGDSFISTDKKLNSVLSTFAAPASVLNIQSVQTNKAGGAFITFDTAVNVGGVGTAGGVIIVDDVNDIETDRQIVGTNTGLLSPKGVTVVDSKNVIIVSDVGSKSLRVFADDKAGDVAPLFSVTDLGNASRTPWDADYDKESDTLYVAGTDGVVAVYNNFFTEKGANGPDRQITPTVNGVKISVNLHGIAYSQDENALVLSDVGLAGNPADGQIFVIADADEVDGPTDVQSRISGSNSRLGNPVDLELKGDKVYIAEKSNNLLMEFKDIFELEGDNNRMSDDSLMVNKPESIAVK